MEETENKVIGEITENVEQATEELVDGAKEESVKSEEVVTEVPEEKIYSKKDFEEKMKSRSMRIEKKLRKEYEKKYGRAEELIKAGTNKESFDDAISELENFYAKEGVKIPQTNNNLSQKDLDYLAERDANEIIDAGYDEIVEEVNRLANIGYENMTNEEKIIFNKLASYRDSFEKQEELSKIGAKEIMNDDNFKKFASQFNSSVSITDIYNLWVKTKPMPEVETIGSMKNNSSEDNSVKDFYTFEEASKFTRKDLDKNPKLVQAIENSMSKWK